MEGFCASSLGVHCAQAFICPKSDCKHARSCSHVCEIHISIFTIAFHTALYVGLNSLHGTIMDLSFTVADRMGCYRVRGNNASSHYLKPQAPLTKFRICTSVWTQSTSLSNSLFAFATTSLVQVNAASVTIFNTGSTMLQSVCKATA